MPTDTFATPQAESIADLNSALAAVQELTKRVASVERSARRWRMSFGALTVALSMGAYAVNDAEFGTVKAKAFQVVGSNGSVLGFIHAARSDGDTEIATFAVSSSDKKRATVITPGDELLRVNK